MQRGDIRPNTGTPWLNENEGMKEGSNEVKNSNGTDEKR